METVLGEANIQIHRGFLPQQCFLQCSFVITVPFYTLPLDGALRCAALLLSPFIFYLFYFLCPLPVWAARPGGGADHGAAVRQHAAGLQRGAVQEAHRHAEAAQEALPRWRGGWQIRDIAVGTAGSAPRWETRKPFPFSCSVGGTGWLCRQLTLCHEVEEVGVWQSGSRWGCSLVPIKNGHFNFQKLQFTEWHPGSAARINMENVLLVTGSTLD